eukprot:5419689-Prymnesium_polylepis.1
MKNSFTFQPKKVLLARPRPRRPLGFGCVDRLHGTNAGPLFAVDCAQGWRAGWRPAKLGRLVFGRFAPRAHLSKVSNSGSG